MGEVTTGQAVHGTAAEVRRLSPSEVEAHLLARDATLVDIRESEELDEHGWIAGSVHVPRDLLESRADPASPLHRPELDPQRLTIVYCGAGDRSALAIGTLESLGYLDVADLDGGIVAWKQADAPVAGLAPWHRLHHDRRWRANAAAQRTPNHDTREQI